MGNQQLLLLVLGTIIVGLAVSVGITQFRAYQVEAEGDEIQSTIMSIVADARIHAEKPTTLGGGGGSFAGFRIQASKVPRSYGVSYSMTPRTGQSLSFRGQNRSGSITARLYHQQGGFTILWQCDGDYSDRTKPSRPLE